MVGAGRFARLPPSDIATGQLLPSESERISRSITWSGPNIKIAGQGHIEVCRELGRLLFPLPNHLESEKPVELGKLIEIAYLVIILAAFAWAKEFLLPLILAMLISFLLAPVVSRLERWRFPRVVAVLSVVAIAIGIIGGLCSTLSLEGLDLVNALPKYRDNIHARWAAVQKGPPGPLNLAFSNIGALVDDLSKVTASAESGQKLEATKVQIVSGSDSIIAMVKNGLTPCLVR